MIVISQAVLMRRYQFFLLWSRYLMWWIGVWKSMGFISRVVCLGLVHICLWFRRRWSVPWCDHPSLILRAQVYCGGAIGRIWVYRFVWWVGWPIWVPFFCFLCEWNTFFVYVKVLGYTKKLYASTAVLTYRFSVYLNTIT